MKLGFGIVAGLTVALALPVLADQPSVGMIWLRDSDGIVISVNNPVDYFTPVPGINMGGGVVYTMDGHTLEFGAVRGGVASVPVAVVNGATYQVEVSGAEVWLLDPATGQRHATQRVAGGMTVNPDGFLME